MRESDPPTSAGVYVFRFPADLVYVGASWDLRHRVLAQLRALRSRRHINRRLQSAWDECGGIDVRVSWRALTVADPFELCTFETRLLEHWAGRVGWARVLNQDLRPAPFTPNGKPAKRALPHP